MNKTKTGSGKSSRKDKATQAASAAESSPSVSAAIEPGAGIDALGELPRSYGSNSLFVVAQEPHWLFTYWDIDIARHPGGPALLRVERPDGTLEVEIEVPLETRNWYIPVKDAGLTYRVEIGYRRGQEWHALAVAAEASTPGDTFSDSDSFEYATVPLHLSFEKLVARMHGAVQDGESLLQALARLQRDGKLFPGGSLDGASLGEDQRTVLDALLGEGFVEKLSSEGLSPVEVESRVRTALSEKLGSAASSGFSIPGSWGPAESSLFAAIGALSSGAERSSGIGAYQAVSSWSPAALSSWAAAALASWTVGAKIPSSWAGAAASSWAPEHLSSWLHTAGVSSGETSSASWAGGSESLSSFGVAREFFMHVNAEVIFYGGTDPRATVTVDGQPIKLNPDGSFRYHFVFPNGEFEIPIVATSPDGVETRCAVLRFERETAKAGGVDDTSQPPLGAPMGAR